MTVRPGSLTRQQLYDRIRESSKDEVVLEEMIRLGYWPDGVDQPNLPDDLIRRRGEITREISDLHRREALWRDPEAALKAMHKRRKKAALVRRAETRLRGARDRHERALAWHERRKTEILYLGEGVSAGLSAQEAAPVSPANGLPPLASPAALARAIGISLGELRFLAYDRALTSVSHYQRFTIPKKTGGVRAISAPMPRLKRAQYWVLDVVLAQVPVHEAAHGFVPGRSILTNAAAHVGRDVVVNLDLKDFFPSLDYRRIKGKFRGLGYAEPVATVLALLCTEPDVDAVEIDGQQLYAARGPRRLPQGAPTSPALTNLVCTRLDARLSGLARSLGFAYTRYADDMTFSASGEAAAKVGPLLKYVHEIVAKEGFTVHPDKTRVMRRGRHQEVTGLTVNERVAVPRETLRRFRALLHGIERHGPIGRRWGRSADGAVLGAALGFARFVRMVTPEVGTPLVARARSLAERHGTQPEQARPRVAAFRERSAQGVPPREGGWVPAEPPVPHPDPLLVQAEAAQAEAARRAEGAADRRVVPPIGRQPPAPQPVSGQATDDADAAGMRPWMVVVGVFVLFQAAALLHPGLGLFVLAAALTIGLRRWLRRRRGK
ncbi:DNA polymerase [Methylobacterium sp. Leaf104]|uniref:reverse transcriptase family protein n=1 Tax=Methylobacterium TaxID=407 RepID=UPI0006FC30FD|nr:MULTISPECIES: reverse transcriptase family protein [Methylobacterium]KQP40052.1 DNA polymerase [Methylobacterium sp. Leaf104]MCI9881933.1 RNA-directed DNA polymerase [Methylobacterium goesingense]